MSSEWEVLLAFGMKPDALHAMKKAVDSAIEDKLEVHCRHCLIDSCPVPAPNRSITPKKPEKKPGLSYAQFLAMDHIGRRAVLVESLPCHKLPIATGTLIKGGEALTSMDLAKSLFSDKRNHVRQMILNELMYLSKTGLGIQRVHVKSGATGERCAVAFYRRAPRPGDDDPTQEAYDNAWENWMRGSPETKEDCLDRVELLLNNTAIGGCISIREIMDRAVMGDSEVTRCVEAILKDRPGEFVIIPKAKEGNVVVRMETIPRGQLAWDKIREDVLAEIETDGPIDEDRYYAYCERVDDPYWVDYAVDVGDLVLLDGGKLDVPPKRRRALRIFDLKAELAALEAEA